MDETWIFQFDPKPKSAPMHRRRPSSPPPKKAKVTQSSGKVMLSCFCDCDGIIMTDYMEKAKTVTGEYYSGLLKRLRSELARRRRGKFRSGVLLLHDNAPAHRARQAAERCGFKILPHLPYSPDLAPSDFCLFPNLKKSIKRRRFEDSTDAITAVEAWFQAKSDTFYSQGLLKVKERWEKCVTQLGAKDILNSPRRYSLAGL
ncbi:transposase [Elysia marginata]|uniref:Transposase n=1 Tax=Elysia marginata TaxID=1093978 RepID=A0AAV4FYZ5_9GAST|nr:transposase [Elysia marginata]